VTADDSTLGGRPSSGCVNQFLVGHDSTRASEFWVGHDFSRAVKGRLESGASAPEVWRGLLLLLHATGAVLTHFCVIVLLLGCAATAQTTAAQKSTRTSKQAKLAHPEFKPFIGTWKLVSSTERHSDGSEKPYAFGPHAAGYLMYDAGGHVCAQVANLDRPHWADPDNPKPEEVKTAFDGFGGYCGTYKVDPDASTAEHIPEVALNPDEQGQPKPRKYRFEQGRLIYSGTEKRPDGEVVWTMTWEKVE